MAFEHYDKCSLLLPMNGANNGTTFEDWSPTAKTVTVAGNAKTVTTQSKYYGSSGYFDGTGDYLTVQGSSSFALSNSDFTIGAWIYLESKTGEKEIIGKWNTNNTSWTITANALNELSFYYSTNGTSGIFTEFTTGISISLNGWHHVAVTRNSNMLKLFIDGVAAYTNNSFTATIATASYNITPGGATGSFKGYINDVFIILGAALWTADFTPPTRLIGSISGTVTDESSSAAARTVIAVPRSYPEKVYKTTSSAVDGSYSLTVPATESSVIVFDDATTDPIYNDLIMRVIPG